MHLGPANDADYPAIVDLINIAFRGTGPSASWNIETKIIEGQRINDSLLREDIAAHPDANLLVHRYLDDGSILGTVWLNPGSDGIWYLGLLTVRPVLQKQKQGRALLAA